MADDRKPKSVGFLFFIVHNNRVSSVLAQNVIFLYKNKNNATKF